MCSGSCGYYNSSLFSLSGVTVCMFVDAGSKRRAWGERIPGTKRMEGQPFIFHTILYVSSFSRDCWCKNRQQLAIVVYCRLN